jgi:hypothetical protein
MSSAVVVPTTEGGNPDMSQAAGMTKMAGGGLVLQPLPLAGGKRRKTARKISKKVLKMLKKMGPAKVAKMMKKGGGEDGQMGEMAMDGAKRRKTARKTRRGFFY